MANGDIAAARIASAARDNGWVAELDVTSTGGTPINVGGAYNFGLGYNNDPAPAATFIAALSPAYDNTGAATTVARSLVATQYVRKPTPNDANADEALVASVLTLRCALSDFIYSGDTFVSISCAAGVYTQSAIPTSATSSLSITNNSTLAYPKSVARWGTVGYQQVTGNFVLEAIVFHRHFRKWKPVACVVFTVADTSGNTVTTTVTEPSLSAQPGDVNPVIAYVATIDVSTLVQGNVLTCNFKVYPWVGSSGSLTDTSVTTGTIQLAALNAGGSGYAIGDTGTINGGNGLATYKVLTLSGSAVATFTLTFGGDGYSTATGAATTKTTGAGNGAFTVNTTVLNGIAGTECLGPLLMLNDKSGTYGSPAAVVASTGHASALSTWVAVDQATAEANYTTSNLNSYTTIAFAIQALKAYNNANNSHNDPGGGRVLLISASHAAPSIGSDQGVQKAWVTVQPKTGVTKAQAIINAGDNADLNVYRMKITGCSLISATVGFLSGDIATDVLWIDDCVVNLTNGTACIYSFMLGYATRNTVIALTPLGFMHFSTTKLPWALIRGNTGPVSASTVSVAFYCVVGNKNFTLASYELGNASNSGLSDGAICAFNTAYALSDTLFGGNTFWTDTHSTMVIGVAFVQNVFERTTATAPLLYLAGDNNTCTTRNVLVWYNTFIGMRCNFAYNDGSGPDGVADSKLHTLWSIVGNIFASFNCKTDTFAGTAPNAARVGNWPVHYHVGSYGNRFLNSANAIGQGPNTWLGMFAGLYANYFGYQVIGTDGKSYICAGQHVADATNDPITGADWKAHWIQRGFTPGDTDRAWVSGLTYDSLDFVRDASYSTGDAVGSSGAGNGNYQTKAGSSADTMFPPDLDALQWDIKGNQRAGSCGAYDVLAPDPGVLLGYHR